MLVEVFVLLVVCCVFGIEVVFVFLLNCLLFVVLVCVSVVFVVLLCLGIMIILLLVWVVGVVIYSVVVSVNVCWMCVSCLFLL